VGPGALIPGQSSTDHSSIIVLLFTSKFYLLRTASCAAMLTVILACGIKDSEEGVKLPKRVCLHQQYVNTNAWSVHYMLTGEDVRLWT